MRGAAALKRDAFGPYSGHKPSRLTERDAFWAYRPHKASRLPKVRRAAGSLFPTQPPFAGGQTA